MSIQITLTPDEERRLAELAHANGKDPAILARDVVATYLNDAGPGGPESFTAVLAPIWEGWDRSGLDEVEVDDLIERELQEARSERSRLEGTPRVRAARHAPSSIAWSSFRRPPGPRDRRRGCSSNLSRADGSPFS